VTDTVCFCRSVPVAMNDGHDVDDDGREKKYEAPDNPFIFESDRLQEYRFINAGSMTDLKQANRKVLCAMLQETLSLPMETGPQHGAAKADNWMYLTTRTVTCSGLVSGFTEAQRDVRSS
jgi:hypothetical protein